MDKDIILPYTLHKCNEHFLTKHADELSALCRSAFHEHDLNGINFGPITMTKERFAQRTKGNIGMYAVLDGQIIAFWNARPDYDKKIVFGDILAVSPFFKGMHIGTHLTKQLAAWLSECGFNLFITDTSLKAPNVVKFHKSYGCKAIGMKHFNGRNYYSVILRLALKPEYEISDMKASAMYFISGIVCKSLVRENGEKTVLSQVFDKFKNIIWKI